MSNAISRERSNSSNSPHRSGTPPSFQEGVFQIDSYRSSNIVASIDAMRNTNLRNNVSRQITPESKKRKREWIGPVVRNPLKNAEKHEFARIKRMAQEKAAARAKLEELVAKQQELNREALKTNELEDCGKEPASPFQSESLPETTASKSTDDCTTDSDDNWLSVFY